MSNQEENLEPLIHREFFHPQTPSKTHTFRVFHWNVLADALSVSSPMENFCKSPPECLKWSYRRFQIMRHITYYSPEVICLQEVDHFHDFFSIRFNAIGYNGFFLPKQNSPCLKIAENNGPDGVAIFYKKSVFSKVDLFQDYLEDETDTPGQSGLLTLVLTHLISEQNIVFAVAHLKAKVEFAERRLAQTKSAVNILKTYANKHSDAKIIFAGDFNGEPHEPFYDYIKNCDLNLDSSYLRIMLEELDFTTWKLRPKYEEKRTIDFIWSSTEGLDVTGVMLRMTNEDIPDNKFPSLDHPSDHIALCFDFTLRS